MQLTRHPLETSQGIFAEILLLRNRDRCVGLHFVFSRISVLSAFRLERFMWTVSFVPGPAQQSAGASFSFIYSPGAERTYCYFTVNEERAEAERMREQEKQITSTQFTAYVL